MDSESCCCIEPAEVYETISNATPTAHKEHKCGECGCVIKKGEKYERFVGKCPITFKLNTHKTCTPCLGIRRDFFTCGWHFGMMREDFYECNGYDYMGIWEPLDEEDMA